MTEHNAVHSNDAVRNVLSNTYERWAGRGRLNALPPRSPDLNPDFYLWRNLITPMYAAPVDNQEALHYRIVNIYQTIRLHLGILERMRPSMMKGIGACIVSHGRYFKHILRSNFSAKTKK